MKQRPKQFRATSISSRNWQRVDFTKNFRDYQCAMLTLLGFSLRFVAQETGFTQAECSYRAALLGIRRSFYRDGLTPLAFDGIETMLERVERDMEKTYRIHYKG